MVFGPAIFLSISPAVFELAFRAATIGLGAAVIVTGTDFEAFEAPEDDFEAEAVANDDMETVKLNCFPFSFQNLLQRS